MQTIGNRIKDLREKNNMTQQQLADVTGISRGNISNYEKGRIDPSANTIIAIAKYFGVSSDWLLTGEGSIVNEAKSTLDETKDLSSMTYLDGKKITSKDRKYLEDFIEGAVGEVMFNLKNNDEELDDEDKALLVSAFKTAFQTMRDFKRTQRAIKKHDKENKDGSSDKKE